MPRRCGVKTAWCFRGYHAAVGELLACKENLGTLHACTAAVKTDNVSDTERKVVMRLPWVTCWYRRTGHFKISFVFFICANHENIHTTKTSRSTVFTYVQACWAFMAQSQLSINWPIPVSIGNVSPTFAKRTYLVANYSANTVLSTSAFWK